MALRNYIATKGTKSTKRRLVSFGLFVAVAPIPLTRSQKISRNSRIREDEGASGGYGGGG
jgi:hypothetical protein